MQRLRILIGCALLAVVAVVGCSSDDAHVHHHHDGYIQSYQGPTLAPQPDAG